MEDEFADGDGWIVLQSAIFEVPMPQDVASNVTILDADLGTLSDSPEAGPRSLYVLTAVTADLEEQRTLTQFRLLPQPNSLDGITSFAGVTGGEDDPKLVVVFQER